MGSVHVVCRTIRYSLTLAPLASLHQAAGSVKSAAEAEVALTVAVASGAAVAVTEVASGAAAAVTGAAMAQAKWTPGKVGSRHLGSLPQPMRGRGDGLPCVMGLSNSRAAPHWLVEGVGSRSELVNLTSLQLR